MFWLFDCVFSLKAVFDLLASLGLRPFLFLFLVFVFSMFLSYLFLLERFCLCASLWFCPVIRFTSLRFVLAPIGFMIKVSALIANLIFISIKQHFRHNYNTSIVKFYR